MIKYPIFFKIVIYKILFSIGALYAMSHTINVYFSDDTGQKMTDTSFLKFVERKKVLEHALKIASHELSKKDICELLKDKNTFWHVTLSYNDYCNIELRNKEATTSAIAHLIFQVNSPQNRALKIIHLKVARTFRNQGLGKAIMKIFENYEFTKTFGYKIIFLESLRESLPFYTNIGFKSLDDNDAQRLSGFSRNFPIVYKKLF